MKRALLASCLILCSLPAFALGKLQRVDLKTGEAPSKTQYPLVDLEKTHRYSPLDGVRPPAIFESNGGQANGGFSFVQRSVGWAAGFWPGGITAVAARHSGLDGKVEEYAIQLQWLNAKSPKVSGGKALASKIRQATGKDAKASWGAVIPSYESLKYEGVWDGVTLGLHAIDGRLAYGFTVASGTPLSTVKIALRGAGNLKLDAKGSLVMEGTKGLMVQTKPRFFEKDSSGGRKEISGRYVILAPDVYGFEVDARTAGLELVVDPEIVFATYFGGSGNDGNLANGQGGGELHGQGIDLAVGSDGHIFLVTSTTSADFPVTAEGARAGSSDMLVARFNPLAAPGSQLVYATYVGGSGFERGNGISTDAAGNAYAVGCSGSTDFPTSTGAVEPSRQQSVGVIAVLDPTGVVLGGSFIGHTMDHHPSSIQISRAGTDPEFVYIAGSAQRPTTGLVGDATGGAFQTQHGGGSFDGYLVKLNLALSQYVYLTYLGGAGADRIMDLAVNNGFAYVTGATASVDFPTTPFVIQEQHSQAATGIDCTVSPLPRQCFDAFVTRVAPAGNALHYSTFLGGAAEEYGRAIALKGTLATITGAARPTTGTTTQIVTTRIDGSGENVFWQTSLTGNGTDHGEEIVIDPLGRVHVVGTITRDGLSTSEATFHGGDGDIFYARLADSDGEVEYFTYLGGSGAERGFAVATQGDREDNFCAFVAGSTSSDDVATVSPIAGGDEHQGGADVLLMSICQLAPNVDFGSFTKATSRTSVVSGNTWVYTMTLFNGGDVPAPVTVTDVVPSQLTIVSVNGDGCGRTGNTVTCNFLAAPGTTSISITVRAPLPACNFSVTNRATLSGGGQSVTVAAPPVAVICAPTCGNGRLDANEPCDPSAGSTNCRADCTRCGDGAINGGEQCDLGANNGPTTACSTTCAPQSTGVCGTTLPACAGTTICGRKCSVVEECDEVMAAIFFWLPRSLFCDRFELCTTPACMPPAEASRVVGP